MNKILAALAVIWKKETNLSLASKLVLSFNQVSQASHVFLGALLVALPIARGGMHFWPVFTGHLLAGGFAALKEFFFDADFESPATRGSDREDFVFYLAGIVIADLVIFV